MSNDSVSDYLTKIRNAISANKREVIVNNTKMLLEMTKILKDESYIEEFKVDGKSIVITLKYINKKSAITTIERVSKPGIRVYTSYQDIPKVISGLGINIFSTSKGILTGKKAKLEKIGGEYLCNIW